MSLDVYLVEHIEKTCYCVECGHEHKTSKRERLYWANITHNLGKMATAAGIYKHLWRPGEIGITKAAQLIEPLTKGIEEMELNPEKYKAFNAPNGWGAYDDFIPWIKEYLNACIEHPESEIIISR